MYTCIYMEDFQHATALALLVANQPGVLQCVAESVAEQLALLMQNNQVSDL